MLPLRVHGTNSFIHAHLTDRTLHGITSRSCYRLHTRLTGSPHRRVQLDLNNQPEAEGASLDHIEDHQGRCSFHCSIRPLSRELPEAATTSRISFHQSYSPAHRGDVELGPCCPSSQDVQARSGVSVAKVSLFFSASSQDGVTKAKGVPGHADPSRTYFRVKGVLPPIMPAISAGGVLRTNFSARCPRRATLPATVQY